MIYYCLLMLMLYSAFNNIWSNFGYGALGLLFFIIVLIR